MDQLRTLAITGICSNTPELVHPYSAISEGGPHIIAHRGATEACPENTLPALRCALGAGFGVETDVRTSTDGEFILSHDATVTRTTDGTGRLARLTSNELRALDAGGWYHEHFRGEQLATLRDALSLATDSHAPFFLDLKEADPARVAAEVARSGLRRRCIVWSKHAPVRRAIARHDHTSHDGTTARSPLP